MIRKRLLSACLALALCLGLLPVTALAAAEGAPSQLYVGNRQVSSGNDITYWTTDTSGGLVSALESDSWNVKYDPTSATLTLSGATIKGGSDVVSIPYGSGIYAQGSSNQPVTLTIELIGENTITGTFGIYVNATPPTTPGTDASLVIKKSGDNGDNGSLTVTGTGNSGLHIISGTGNASLTIKNVSVVANATSSYSGSGVCVQSGASATDSPNISLSVDGGSLTASGTGSNDGILFYVGQSQATGATTSLTVSENAIVDARNGGIKALKISETLPTPTPTGDNRSGIVFDGSTGTVYGDVTLQEDLEIGEGESLAIPEGSSLDMGGNEITVASGGKLEGTPTGSGTVKIAPTITTESLPDGEVGTAYSQTLVATGDTPITWTVSGTLPAGLSLDAATGIISGTPTAQGTSNFTVTATNDYGSDSKEFTLTIDQQGTIHVTSVSLDKTSLELTEGGTDTLTATITPNNATNKNVTWESSNTSVATVDANGLVTAVSAGTATITVTTEDGRKTATCTVTVKPAEYTVTVLTDGKGSASASPATAEAGTTVTLTADPDNGWRFSRWEVVEGDVTISGNSFTMPDENVTVRAVFSPIVNIPDTYDIDLIVGEGGEARLSLTNASEGSTITVTATPDAGYELDYITVDGERIDGTTFTMPDHDVTVRVYFTDGSATLPFTDVSTGAWYFDAVSYVYANGLMDGTSGTTFEPDANMTRAMVWAILARVDGETVTGANWADTAREWAVANGVSDGENASGYVTREQLAAMLWRYAVYKGYDVSIGEDTNILSYADFADLSEYAIPAMQWACGAGIITGMTDATLVPQGEATRAQVAAMLMRFCEAIG